MKNKCALLLGGGAHLSDVLTLLQAGDPRAKAKAESIKVVFDRFQLYGQLRQLVALLLVLFL